MRTETQTTTLEEVEADRPAYVRPQIQDLGSIVDLTLGGGDDQLEEGFGLVSWDG